MEIDLKYYKTKGIYTMNGFRVIVLPKGSFELIQMQVGKILGIATKSIFEDAMSTTIYSFLTDLIKSKQLKLHSEEKSEDEIFSLLYSMGLGKISVLSKDVDSYNITVRDGFNSILPDITSINSCFQMNGVIAAVYRIMMKRDIKVNENKCKSTGDSDMDWFKVSFLDKAENFNYISQPSYSLEDQPFDKIEIGKYSSDMLINSIPIEIVPVIFFPYLFSKLRKIIGVSVHGIEYGIGLAISKLYSQYNLQDAVAKYQTEGLDVLSPISGLGLIKTIKNNQGSIEQIDVYDSFNSLHIDQENEKRCFMVSGMFTNLSSKIFGSSYKLYESDCSSINNSVCKFSFE
ncbi:MAG: hypothetical protein M1433_03215 [Candidatus Parvarchaeota archaeon]|nr:hypothetical protein [Candidatus Parvarchaeota archaeon]